MPAAQLATVIHSITASLNMGDSNDNNDSYQLGFSLHGHASDVRDIAAPAFGLPLLLSASRDGSAIVWGPSRDGMWEAKLRVEGPEKRYVSCVGMIRANGNGALASSSQITERY